MKLVESHGSGGINAPRSRLRWLVISQISLLFVAATVFAYIGWRIKPLVQEQKTLLEKLDGLQRDVADKNIRLQSLLQQIHEKETVLRELNVAIANSKDKSLVSQAGRIELQPLRGFKIGIHYLEGNEEGATRAHALLAALRAANSPAEIAIYEKPRTFFVYFGRAAVDELRYEPDFESAQAQALAGLLRRIDPQHNYLLTPVDSRTPNFISIFLADGLK